MTYTEFITEYKKAIKTYPDIISLFSYDEDEKKISYTCTRFERETTGKRWKETESNTKPIDFIMYANIIDPRTVSFFRNLGGKERVTASYTKMGYLPVEVVSTSPDGLSRTTHRFSFI